MASYAFATLQARQTLQELWEQGKTVKDMAAALDVPLSTLYTELRRGRSGVRLPDQRLQYAKLLKDMHFVMAGGDPCKVCAKVCMMGEGNCQPEWTGEKTED